MFDGFNEELLREIIGDEIRATRTARGVTLNELAEKVEMSEEKLAEIEDGDSSFDLADLEQIAEALNTHLKVNFEPLDLSQFAGDFHLDPGWMFQVQFLQRLYGEFRGEGESIEDFIQEAIEEKLERMKSKPPEAD